MIIVVMGVSGAGKTTVGSLLATRLGCEFLDADAFHPPENVAKMAAGVPLTDEDRQLWLVKLHRALAERAANGTSVVLACSALKDSYRKVLEDGVAIRWVYLRISPETAHERLRERVGHYAKETLVESQFETLEEPRDALVVDGEKEPDAIVEEIVRAIGTGGA
jgi:gluconokinase